jgi:hypothetical protein
VCPNVETERPVTNKLLMPSETVLEADVSRPGGFKRRYRGSIVSPVDSHDETALREFGATSAGLATGAGGRGRRCELCGFGSWFTTCSRCGGECTREGE